MDLKARLKKLEQIAINSKTDRIASKAAFVFRGASL